MIKIYTDGSCSSNPGPGGWAAILIQEGDNPTTRDISGSDPDTTNNRMEMLAVIEGLRAIDKDKSIPADEPIEVYSDSAYIVNCFKDGWYKKWQKNGWTNSAGKPVENKDLWEAMISLVHKRNASLKKVKGHANDELNNRCDELAKKAVWRESK